MPRFVRYLGIDYSGAETSSLKGLRLFAADGKSATPAEVMPPPRPRKYWTRKGLAHWLADQINAGPPVLARDWPAFLDDFNAHWATDDDNTYVCFFGDGLRGLLLTSFYPAIHPNWTTRLLRWRDEDSSLPSRQRPSATHQPLCRHRHTGTKDERPVRAGRRRE